MEESHLSTATYNLTNIDDRENFSLKSEHYCPGTTMRSRQIGNEQIALLFFIVGHPFRCLSVMLVNTTIQSVIQVACFGL